MRGGDRQQTILFSYLSIDDQIPGEHPLRGLRAIVNALLVQLSERFSRMYATMGRPSIPPEHLLRALILQKMYTIRSEAQLMEHLRFNLLYRWFVGLNPDDAVWDPTTFTKNRSRLEEAQIADAFLNEVLTLADAGGLLSHEHFTVDGTLLAAWASHKSVRPIDDPSPPPSDGDPKNPSVDFKGETRSNATHRSVTDPDARLARKSDQTASILAYQASVITDNRHGLIVATDVRSPSGTAEREAGAEMLTVVTAEPRARRRTLGADKGYDTLWRMCGRVRRRRMWRRTFTRGVRGVRSMAARRRTMAMG